QTDWTKELEQLLKECHPLAKQIARPMGLNVWKAATPAEARQRLGGSCAAPWPTSADGLRSAAPATNAISRRWLRPMGRFRSLNGLSRSADRFNGMGGVIADSIRFLPRTHACWRPSAEGNSR